MESQNVEILGEVEITLAKGKKFSITASYSQDSVEVYFVLYVIDRILFDIKDMDHKQSISSMLARYISNQRNEREKLDRLFGKYTLSSAETNKTLLKVSHKMIRSISSEGRNFDFKTEYSFPNISNFEGKLSIATMLYVIELMKRLPVENQKFISDAYTVMLKEYTETGFPTDKYIGSAPLMALITVSNSRKG